MWSVSPRLESSQFFIKWTCFWQYWEFRSMWRRGCCSQTLLTSIQFIQLFIVLLWSPSFSFSLSFSLPLSLFLFLVSSVCLCLCTVCFYCHKGTFSDPSSCRDGHPEGPSDGTGLFTSSELSIEYVIHGQVVLAWQNKYRKVQTGQCRMVVVRGKGWSTPNGTGMLYGQVTS